MSRITVARLGSRSRVAVPLFLFSLAALGAGAGRALTTTYLPVLLERIDDSPHLIGAVMTVNAVTGFAVPIAVGLWSDRCGRRLPFIAGGALLTAGGLVAVGLGNASSYVALALAAAVVYSGLNALTTAHRALVAQDIEDEGRPAATSAQELAGLGGAVLAVAIGGLLVEPAPAAAFGIAAVLVAASAVPTTLLVRRLSLGESKGPAPERQRPARIGDALRIPGARAVLLAQTMWVFAYAALPAFFVLYAEEVLALDVGLAGLVPLGFGALTAVAIVAAGRVRAERVRGSLLAGTALIGAGLLAAMPASSLPAAAPGLAVAAVGAGVVTALGFPYFARWVPENEAGHYSGIFFAGRAVAAAAALPLAGLAVELSGSYRTLLGFGFVALAALAPLALAERRRHAPAVGSLQPASLAAVIPVFASNRAVDVARATLEHVDELVLVDDGAPTEIARSLDAFDGEERVQIIRQGSNGGKGSAVAAGVRSLLARPEPPDAIVVLDSDGQHDPSRIAAFAEAGRHSDMVIGNRRDRASMPRARRIGNRVASLVLLLSARAWVPDTQNGMRLFRVDALRDVPLPTGGYDAEARHLRALLAAGKRVRSVDIPTIYDGEPSHFKPLADTLRVGRALLGASRPAPAATGEAALVLREWAPRLTAAVLAAIALGAALPVFQPLDNTLELAINGLGDGPEWLYRALDPHTRNYLLLAAVTLVAASFALRRPRHVLGAILAVVLAAYLSGAVLEVVKLFIDRARPEEVLGAQVQLSHGRSWAHIASYPSGHLIVTSAMAAAAAAAVPALRTPLIGYVALVALTRVTFGAHFPIDVLVGAALGRELGLFAARLLAAARMLPAREPRAQRVPVPLPSRTRA